MNIYGGIDFHTPKQQRLFPKCVCMYVCVCGVYVCLLTDTCRHETRQDSIIDLSAMRNLCKWFVLKISFLRHLCWALQNRFVVTSYAGYEGMSEFWEGVSWSINHVCPGQPFAVTSDFFYIFFINSILKFSLKIFLDTYPFYIHFILLVLLGLIDCWLERDPRIHLI